MPIEQTPGVPEGGAESSSEMQELARRFAEKLGEQVAGFVNGVYAIVGERGSPGYADRYKQGHAALKSVLNSEALVEIARGGVDGKFGYGFYDNQGINKGGI